MIIGRNSKFTDARKKVHILLVNGCLSFDASDLYGCCKNRGGWAMRKWVIFVGLVCGAFNGGNANARLLDSLALSVPDEIGFTLERLWSSMDSRDRRSTRLNSIH